MISVERLEKLSNDLSFEAATIERVVRLIDVLERLTKDREIGHLFALKGRYPRTDRRTSRMRAH